MTRAGFLKRYNNLHNGVFIIDFQDEAETHLNGVTSFGQLTQKAFGIPNEKAVIWKVHEKGAPSLADIGPARFIIGTGSTNDTRENTPWMEQAKELFRKLSERNDTYIFGTCFTHQLLAEAFGGEVQATPGGIEFGNTFLAQTESAQEHWLLEGVPDIFVLNLSHGDSVVKVGSDWQVLASSELCENQIIAFKPNVIGIQGHLEFTNATMSVLVNADLWRNWMKKQGKTDLGLKLLDASFASSANEKFARRITQNLLTWANGEHTELAPPLSSSAK